MTGRRGNPLVLRKILPTPDLVIASTRADIGFYIVSLVGQVIFNTISSLFCKMETDVRPTRVLADFRSLSAEIRFLSGGDPNDNNRCIYIVLLPGDRCP